MKQRIALLVYPEFSLQEVGNLMALFRWYYDSPTDIISTDLSLVRSEEGVLVVPDKTTSGFKVEDYDCLILPGISDIRLSLDNHKLIQFLSELKNHPDFLIGAICGGPIFLSMAGLLDDKPFINQLYVEMNDLLPFIQAENIVYQPVVVAGNIITAIGPAYAQFAIEVARALGYGCPDQAYTSVIEDPNDESLYEFHLDQEGLAEFKRVFSKFLQD